MKNGELTSKFEPRVLSLFVCRTAVNEEVDAYVERQYTKNKARASICFNEEGKLQVDISCISTNLGKFWTGEWQSQFLVDI